MEIKLYNTRLRKKETFTPLKKKQLKIYTCGPTVYNYAHIGNLRAFLFSDMLKRMFSYFDYEITDVMNITDVGHLTDDADSGEDKMLKGAKREKKSVFEIAEHYTQSFLEDMKLLNIQTPKKLPKATDHIKEMILVIKKLEEKGYTYQAGGNVYFDTSKFSDYAKFAKLPKETKSRVGKDKNKKNERDFVLWFTQSKFEDQAMKWESPWGIGYPGWHIECSAMSWKYLGDKFDIHTGGEDHIPVHHTNEIAQSQCAFDSHPWVNYWMHSAFLTIKEGKMAKSGANFITLQTLVDKGYLPMHYRYFTLTAHYRMNLAFSYEALEGARNAYEKLKRRVIEISSSKDKGDASAFIEEFESAISDDLNMPKALAVVWKILDSDIGGKGIYEALNQFDLVLGLGISQMKEDTIPKEILLLAKQRDEARAKKDFAKSDELRDKIAQKGYVIEDINGSFSIRKQ